MIISGFGCRLPKNCNSPNEAYEIFRDGRVELSSPYDSGIVRNRVWKNNEPVELPARAGFYQDIDMFDNTKFNIPEEHAREMDPQQKMALETTLDAINDASIPLKKLQELNTGVYVGASHVDFREISSNRQPHINRYTLTGCSLGNLANNISYYLDFTGPSLTVDTACSSSLYALYLARNAMERGEIDCAVVVGVTAMLNSAAFKGFAEGGFLSMNGNSLAFNKDADGFTRGEGCVACILIRERYLEKVILNNSYARLGNVAVNENGHHRMMARPKYSSQKSLIRKVMGNSQIKYIEAHGTGTRVGDAVEAQAIIESLQECGLENVYLGTAKANFGHAEPASGMFGLLRACLSLKHKCIFPLASITHVDQINPTIEKMNRNNLHIPLYFRENESFDDYSVLINSFGVGGTNACAVLENISEKNLEPKYPMNILVNSPDLYGEFPLDGQLNPALCTKSLYGTDIGKREVVFAGSCNDAGSCNEKISAGEIRKGKVTFFFGGQGCQHTTMGRDLYNDIPHFRESINRYCEYLDRIWKEVFLEIIPKSHDYSIEYYKPKLKERGFCKDGLSEYFLSDPVVSNMTNIIFQMAMLDLLQYLNIQPDIVVGHSTGEIVACYANNRDYQSTIYFAYQRSLIQTKIPKGKMMAFRGSVEDFQSANNKNQFKNECEIGVINTEKMLTITGTKRAIEELNTIFPKSKILESVSIPNHSQYVDSVKREFDSIKLFPQLTKPEPQFVSTTYGDLLTNLSGYHWWKNIRSTVEFYDACRKVGDMGSDILIDLSPNCILEKSIIANLEGAYIPLQKNKSDTNATQYFIRSLCQIIANTELDVYLHRIINDNPINGVCRPIQWNRKSLKSDAWLSAENSMHIRDNSILVDSPQDKSDIYVSKESLTDSTQSIGDSENTSENDNNYNTGDIFMEIVKDILEFPKEKYLDENRSLIDYGFDSLSAIELKSALKEKRINVELINFLDHRIKIKEIIEKISYI